MKSTKKCILIPYEKYQRMIQKQQPDSPELKSDLNSDINVEQDSVSSEPDGHSEVLTESDILKHIPKALNRRAKSLLEVVKQSPVLGWNAQGELTVEGKTISQSHIADLVKDALVQHKNFEPTGLYQFYANLQHIPLTAIGNPNRRHLIQRGAGSTQTAPPPGIPDRKRKTRTLQDPQPQKLTRKDVWKKSWQTLT